MSGAPRDTDAVIVLAATIITVGVTVGETHCK